MENKTEDKIITAELPQETIEKIEEKEEKMLSTPINEPKFIRKKKEFRIFKKLIKDGKFTTAYITAKALKLDYTTVAGWLNIPSIRKQLNKEVDQYVNKISVNKDWKASAYLLDKITDAEIKTPSTSTMIGLSINITPSK